MKSALNNGSNPALVMAAGILIVFLFSGILFSIAHGVTKTGFLPEDIRVYYTGSEADMIYAKEFAELMESTHVHLFMIPLIFYILSHLFVQTGIADRWKVSVVTMTFGNIVVFLIAPYLVRFVSPRLAPLITANYLLFFLCALILAAAPLRAMLFDGGGVDQT